MPPTGAEDGMLIELAPVLVACACDPGPGWAVGKPGVKAGGSGANAPSRQISAQIAHKNGSIRVIVALESDPKSIAPFTQVKVKCSKRIRDGG